MTFTDRKKAFIHPVTAQITVLSKYLKPTLKEKSTPLEALNFWSNF